MSYDLKPNVGSKHKKTRRGCGKGSGLGKTGGKGTKGQLSRAGRTRPYMGFEGGQMPLYRRIPKRGFKHFGIEYTEINLSRLSVFVDGDVVNHETLAQKGMIKNPYYYVKILGMGEISAKLTVEVDHISATAKEKIEKAGGSVKIISLEEGN